MDSQKDKQFGIEIYNSSLFDNDLYSAFLYRKSQSLVAALYLVTEHFADQEPMKWSIRNQASILLNACLALPFIQGYRRKEMNDQIFSSSLQVLSFIQIAVLTKLITK